LPSEWTASSQVEETSRIGYYLIVFCELPGEKLAGPSAPARWIARPASRNCPWSNIQMPPAMLQQIQEHLAAVN
jgi:hypothetical protein